MVNYRKTGANGEFQPGRFCNDTYAKKGEREGDALIWIHLDVHLFKKNARVGVLEQGLNKHPACYESNCNLVLHDVHGDISFIEIVHLSACFFPLIHEHMNTHTNS